MPLEDSLRKLERARHHLESIYDATAAVAPIEDEGEEVPVEFDTETSEYVIRKAVPDIDPMLALMVGDFAHNVRSALDCAVVELGRHNRKRSADKGSFPIFRSKTSSSARGSV